VTTLLIILAGTSVALILATKALLAWRRYRALQRTAPPRKPDF
jgi:hypothetical protein